MEFTSIKQTLIGFTVFLTILLGSCGIAEDTAPPNNPPPIDYMSFVLTNSTGTTVTTSTSLSRGSTYGLVITPASGTTIPTADYTITYTPLAAITTNVIRTNSVDFTVNNTADRTVTISVAHRTNSAVSESITLNLVSQVVTTFQQNIENATTVPNLVTANALTREVLTPLGASAGATLVKRYVTETGGATTRDGTSWATAWTGASLRNNITNITDATANRVYLVMVAGGTYKPDYSTTAGTTERAISFSMTNHVAIMGGFDPAGGWGRTGTTIFSGDIGTVDDSSDNSYSVFFHNTLTLNNAHLYGVTITNGNANGSSGNQLRGGGMYNSSSSPVLTRVVFSGNTAGGSGGGMYNSSSSPVLTEVVFSGNTGNGGGGMYNVRSSSPVLTGVVFSGNTAGDGGGMFNDSSSPVLTMVVFSGNNARDGGGMFNRSSSPVLTRVVFSRNTIPGPFGKGGGMYNDSSSPVLISVVFTDNNATEVSEGGGMYNEYSSPVIIGAVFTGNSASNGGGMLNDSDSRPGPLIVNTIFSGNTLTGTGSGTNIVMLRDSSSAENIRIAGSVLGLGLAQPTNDIVGYKGTATINISYHSLANGAVNFGADATLTINGMNFTYPTITTGSSAINRGLFVRRSGTTYYFSEDESTWYTSFSATGGWGSSGTPPGNATDLTATDIAGNARNGRPDAGVFEVR